MKKIFASTLALSLLLSAMVFPAAAATPSYEDTKIMEQTRPALLPSSIELDFGTEHSQVFFSSNGQFDNAIVHYADGSSDFLTYNRSTDKLYYNGKLISTETNIIPASEHDYSALSSTSGKWVYHDTYNTDIDVTGMAAAAATAAILLKVGAVSPMASAVVGAAVAKFMDDNFSGLIAFSVKTKYYYWEPIVTSRPLTKKEFSLYSGLGCKAENYLCDFT